MKFRSTLPRSIINSGKRQVMRQALYAEISGSGVQHTLQRHLAYCPLVMRTWGTWGHGLEQAGSRIFLVTSEADLPAALLFLERHAPRAELAGTHVAHVAHVGGRREAALHGMDYAAAAGSGPGSQASLPLQALEDFPEARVLLYASSYLSSPVQKTDGHLLARDIAHLCASFSLAPGADPDPGRQAWHRRRDPDFYAEHAIELEKTYALLEDADSKNAYAMAIKALLTGDPGYIRPARFGQYMHPCVPLRPGDRIIDGGMYSLRDTLHWTASATDGAVFGFEPEPALFQSIQRELPGLHAPVEIRAFPFGIGARCEDCHIVGNDSGSWLTRTPRAGSSPCRMIDIDSFTQESGIDRIDVIKFDIEGCELDGLRGAEATIRKHKPRLMLSAYHKFEDLFAIPALVRSFVPEYKTYFACHHMFIGEFIFYMTV